ncbi:uncharacterized protein LOC135171228 [Diachasmimorpha longicaudata]|uniref:uncharacterized protein LOC135171228 n=1 Tax=Diachasmimorpha longicaudata TaxID=58733 RepID=UPI0030B910CD
MKMKSMQRQSAWVEQGVIDKYVFSDSCTIRLVIIIFKLLGLAPISVSNSRSLRANTRNSTQGLTFKSCVSAVVYIYIMMIIILAASVLTVPLINAETPDSDADLLDTFEAAKGVLGVIVLLLVWLIVSFRYKTTVKILNKIVEMDNEMLMLHDLYYLESSKPEILIMYLVNIIVWVAIFVLEIVSIPDSWRTWIPLLLPSFVMNWFIMQYILILVMIENRFVSVNRAFIMISNSRIETFFHADVRPVDVSERMIVNNFITLRRAHSMLADICRDVADYYSLPILPTIAFFCGASIYYSYYIIVPLVAKARQQSVLEIINMSCWLLMQILPIVVLSVCVTRVHNQMGLTGGSVYKVLARSILDYIAKDELKKFSFELLHKNIQFTAYDIFSLDCTLIQSIFGMLATYLIILVQFQLTHTSKEYYILDILSSMFSTDTAQVIRAAFQNNSCQLCPTLSRSPIGQSEPNPSCNMYLFTRAFLSPVLSTFSYLFFKALGLIPGRLRNFKNAPPSFEYSLAGVIHICLVTVTFAVLSVFSINALYSTDYPNKSSTTEVIELSKASLGSIILLILWVWICIHQREAVKASNDFFEIDTLMIPYRHLHSPKTLGPRFVLFWVLNTVNWVNMIWSDYVVFDEVSVLSLIAAVGPNFIFNWLLLMYTFSITSLMMQFRAVNDAIVGFSRVSVSSISTSSKVSNDVLVMKNFFALKYVHIRLHEVVRVVDRFYSFPILLIIGQLAVSIVYTSYYLVLPMFVPSLEQRGLLLFNSACYLSMEVVPITLMTIAIGQFEQELVRTADVVHKFLTRTRLSGKAQAEVPFTLTISKILGNLSFGFQLRLFSLELLHQNVQFTACGIFALDGTLLHSICGMTATYLIILIQFQSASFPSTLLSLFFIQFALLVQVVRRRVQALNSLILRKLDTYINDDIVRTFQAWKKAQDELHEACVVLADFYSFPLLFGMAFLYYAVICISFYTAKDLWKSAHRRRPMIHLLNDPTWMMILVMSTALLLFEIDELQNQMTKKAAVCRKLTLKFRRNGQLQSRIFGTTVTYLIILIQFLMFRDEQMRLAKSKQSMLSGN